MGKVKFDKGVEANLPTTDMVEEGHVYVTEDNGNVYLGKNDGTLVPFNRCPYYGTCQTAAGTAAKTVQSLSDGARFFLKAGVIVIVKFDNANTAASPTLNVCSTGAVGIKEYGTTAIGSSASLAWRAGEAVAFLYDGTNWLRVSHIIDIVQSDWEQSTDNSADFIKNKPAIVKGTGSKSIQEGNNTSATGSYSHAQNNGTKAIGANSHAEGANTVAVGGYAHAEGTGTATAISGVSGGTGSSTTVYSTTADHGLSVGDIVEYNGTYTTVSNIVNPRLFMVSETLGELSSATINLVKGVAYKRGSHVEGRDCIATGEYAHAEGYGTEAGANYTHAEGYGTKAIGSFSHTEGRDTEASGSWSHAEGRNTVAGGNYAHAEGRNTTAGHHSHSEGYYTEANCVSYGAHAEGANTVTNNDCEHAEGRFNVSNQKNTTFGDAGNTIHSIGIGTAANKRKNAVEVMQNGDVYIDRVGNYNGSGGVMTLQDVLALYIKKIDVLTRLNVRRVFGLNYPTPYDLIVYSYNYAGAIELAPVGGNLDIPEITSEELSLFGFTGRKAQCSVSVSLRNTDVPSDTRLELYYRDSNGDCHYSDTIISESIDLSGQHGDNGIAVVEFDIPNDCTEINLVGFSSQLNNMRTCFLQYTLDINIYAV